MKNIERIFFYTVLIVAIAIMGVLIYEKINDNDTVGLLNEHIAELESDNNDLIRGLQSVRARVITLQGTLEEFESENNRLKDILKRSSEIAGEAESENKKLTESIDRAIGIIRKIRTENQRQ